MRKEFKRCICGRIFKDNYEFSMHLSVERQRDKAHMEFSFQTGFWGDRP